MTWQLLIIVNVLLKITTICSLDGIGLDSSKNIPVSFQLSILGWGQDPIIQNNTFVIWHSKWWRYWQKTQCSILNMLH